MEETVEMADMASRPSEEHHTVSTKTLICPIMRAMNTGTNMLSTALCGSPSMVSTCCVASFMITLNPYRDGRY